MIINVNANAAKQSVNWLQITALAVKTNSNQND